MRISPPAHPAPPLLYRPSPSCTVCLCGPGPAAALLPWVSKGLTASRRSGLARSWPTSRRTSPPSRLHDATARPRAEEMDHRRQQPATAAPLCHGPMAAPAVSPGDRGQADPERRATRGPSTGSGAAAKALPVSRETHQSSETVCGRGSSRPSTPCPVPAWRRGAPTGAPIAPRRSPAPRVVQRTTGPAPDWRHWRNAPSSRPAPGQRARGPGRQTRLPGEDPTPRTVARRDHLQMRQQSLVETALQEDRVVTGRQESQDR